MSNTNTGGPAFPATEEHGCNSGWSGMDLRDYFAAKAMQGWLATYSSDVECVLVGKKAVAEFAYSMADAMLKAREA